MTYRTLAILAVATLSSCLHSTTNNNESAQQSIISRAELIESIRGDFDGNGTDDEASLLHLVERDSTSAITSERYMIVLNHTDSTLYQTEHQLSHLTHEGDLNGDGGAELGIYRNSSHSAWGEYVVMSYTDTWHEKASTTLNVELLERLSSVPNFDEIVTPDSEHNGNINVRHHTIVNSNEVTINTTSIEL